jgi:hypothetical protein
MSMHSVYTGGTGAFVNRFEQTGPTAEKRLRKVIGAWVQHGPIAPVMFGNALVQLITLIGF